MNAKQLTCGELDQIETRIEEIDRLIDLCRPGYDDDVIQNMECELDDLCRVIEASLKASTRSHLRLIKRNQENDK